MVLYTIIKGEITFPCTNITRVRGTSPKPFLYSYYLSSRRPTRRPHSTVFTYEWWIDPVFLRLCSGVNILFVTQIPERRTSPTCSDSFPSTTSQTSVSSVSSSSGLSEVGWPSYCTIFTLGRVRLGCATLMFRCVLHIIHFIIMSDVSILWYKIWRVGVFTLYLSHPVLVPRIFLNHFKT